MSIQCHDTVVSIRKYIRPVKTVMRCWCSGVNDWIWSCHCHPMIYLSGTDLPTHKVHTHARTHTHTFNGPLSESTRYQKGKTNLDFTEARDSEWQWHKLGDMEVCTSLQADNHVSTSLLVFLQAGCPSCRPTNSVKALKAVTKVRKQKNSMVSTKHNQFPGHIGDTFF